MKNGISIGLAIGMVIGAFVVNNCSGVRNLVDETQRKVKSKIQKANCVTMNNCECSCDCECASDYNTSSIPDGESEMEMA